MKPKIQMQIGLCGAIVFTIFGLVQFIRGQQSSTIGLWITFTSLPLFVFYIFGIVKRKLKTTQIVFNIWCVLASVTICIIFLALLLEKEEGDSLLMLVSLIFLPLVAPAAVVTVILWTGLRGLKRIISANKISIKN